MLNISKIKDSLVQTITYLTKQKCQWVMILPKFFWVRNVCLHTNNLDWRGQIILEIFLSLRSLTTNWRPWGHISRTTTTGADVASWRVEAGWLRKRACCLKLSLKRMPGKAVVNGIAIVFFLRSRSLAPRFSSVYDSSFLGQLSWLL